MNIENKRFFKDLTHNEQGFALVIIPIVFVLFGMFVTAVMSEAKTTEYYFETSTQTAMQDVRKSLAAYTHRNYRVPCPGDPEATGAALGTETDVGANDRCTVRAGILPFRALGLNESDAKDEWGHYYTYKISPGFSKKYAFNGTTDGAKLKTHAAGQMPVGGNDPDEFLHEMCRTAAWSDSSTSYTGRGR